LGSVPRRAEYLALLRKETAMKVELRVPRVEVATTGGYEKGPKDAPITLVEFSDFQCPLCSRSQARVNEVLAKYALLHQRRAVHRRGVCRGAPRDHRRRAVAEELGQRRRASTARRR